MTTRFQRILSLFLLTLLLGACGNPDVEVEIDDDSTVTATPDTVRDTTVVRTPPDTVRLPDTTKTSASSTNIRVESPVAGDEVSGSFTLRGTARTFENNVAYRLSAPNGTTLAEGFTTATGEMGTFSPYKVTVSAKPGYTGPAKLEVFQNSAKDGSEIDKVIVPVKITRPASELNVVLYYTNAAKGSTNDCSKVFPVNRNVPHTQAVAESALKELLQGPTMAEREKGFGTEIPADAQLLDITIEKGVARADFNADLNRAAGACRVTAIRSQIEQTLRQFPSVSRVVITVDGKSEGVLQP